MITNFKIAAFLAIFAIYFVVGYFKIDVSQYIGFNIETEEAQSNPLLDVTPGHFFAIANPIVEDYDNGRECSRLWENDDPGPLDCTPLANKIARRFDASIADAADPAIWKRYREEQKRATVKALIND